MRSWLSPAIEVRPGLRAQGWHAVQAIQCGELLAVWGDGYGDEGLARASGRPWMRWDVDLYSVADAMPAELVAINHSCDPNSWLGKVSDEGVEVVARTDISPGEEVGIDYGTFLAEPEYTSEWGCRCGSPLCRTRITGNDWRRPELQVRYRGHFSPWIEKLIAGCHSEDER